MLHTQIHTPPGTRLAQFARMIEAFERDDIENAVDMLIERLDAQDGDCDLEEDDHAGGNVDDEGEIGTAFEGAQGWCNTPNEDEGEECAADISLRRVHRDRIRRDRCDLETTFSRYGTFRDFTLRERRS